MNTSMTVALALVMALSGTRAYAQTEQPNAHHHTHHYAPHHMVHRHTAPAPVATAPQAGPFGLALPHIAPYPDNQGGEDGLSLDPDDCMKGCIGGNPQ